VPSAARRRALADAPAPQLVVSYWDEGLQAYSRRGMVSMPSPAPSGAVLTWRANFTAASDADLPLAWSLALPGCRELLVNCSDAWERTLTLSLDPETSVGDPVVRCSDDTAS